MVHMVHFSIFVVGVICAHVRVPEIDEMHHMHHKRTTISAQIITICEYYISFLFCFKLKSRRMVWTRGVEGLGRGGVVKILGPRARRDRQRSNFCRCKTIPERNER